MRMVVYLGSRCERIVLGGEFNGSDGQVEQERPMAESKLNERAKGVGEKS